MFIYYICLCIGDVYYGLSDIAIAVSPSIDRMSVVQFSSAIRYTVLTFVTHKPKVYYSWTAIFHAFGKYAWITIFCSVLSTAFVLFGLEKIAYKNQLMWQISWQSNILYLYSYLISQHVYISIKSGPSFLLFGIWLCCGYVISVFYCCSLQSLIVSPGLSHIPERIMSDLIPSKYEWGASKAFLTGLGGDIFKQSENAVVKTLHEKMFNEIDDDACLYKAATSNYACFDFDINSKFLIGLSFTDKFGHHPFQFAKDSLYFTAATFITRKGEIFASHFNNFISRFFSMGLESQTMKIDLRKVRKTKENVLAKINMISQNGNYSPLSMGNMKAAFLILIGGISLGIFCLGTELFQESFDQTPIYVYTP